MPKVLMHHSEDSGVSYYRMWMQSKYLKRIGWEVVDFPDHLPVMTTADWEEKLKGVDLFVTQKSDNPQLLALVMAAREMYNIPIVFEIDDDIYDISKNSPAYQYFHPGSPFIEMNELMMKNMDAMTVSTQALKDVYSKHCQNIYVLPNAQDPEDYQDLQYVKGRRKDELVIGWAGSSTHYDDLKLIRRPMLKILKKYPHVKFRILGCLPDFFAGHDQVQMRTDWAPIRQWQGKLASMGFDIGLCPIVHRPFNLGKSNIKWQEYSMLEIPTIASRVGEYKAIEHGVTGYLADSEYAWVTYLEKLIEDAELRQTIGKAAKQKVLADFNIERNIDQWAKAYERIIADFKS